MMHGLPVDGVTRVTGDGDDDLNIVEVSADYTVLVTDDVVISSGNNTITLPPLASATKNVTIKSVSGLATVDGSGSETIEGNLTVSVTPNSAVTLSPTSLEWVIV